MKMTVGVCSDGSNLCQAFFQVSTTENQLFISLLDVFESHFCVFHPRYIYDKLSPYNGGSVLLKLIC